MDVDQILEIIINHTKQIVPGLDDHDFSASDSLRDLGANSIDRSEIAMLTLESVGVSIPMVELIVPKNIGELARLIARYQ
jgi:polyketide biosynthesis acyl carrier protein